MRGFSALADGAGHPFVGVALANQALVQRLAADVEAAVTTGRRALDVLSRAVDDVHPWRLAAQANLAQALAGEVGELSEIFQWLSEAESRRLSDQDRRAVEEELADIVIYVLRLADELSIDLEQAVDAKQLLNEAHYPVHTSKGDRTKHTAKGEGFHVRNRTS